MGLHYGEWVLTFIGTVSYMDAQAIKGSRDGRENAQAPQTCEFAIGS